MSKYVYAFDSFCGASNIKMEIKIIIGQSKIGNTPK